LVHGWLIQLYEGVRITHTALLDVFKRHHIAPMEAAGSKFDPNHHSALFQMPDPTKESGTVGVVLKRGYLLHERVLRPAEVGVVQNPQ
jgi:molecular chaperone GrpE